MDPSFCCGALPHGRAVRETVDSHLELITPKYFSQMPALLNWKLPTQMHLSDELVNAIAGGFDLAIRIGRGATSYPYRSDRLPVRRSRNGCCRTSDPSVRIRRLP
jgi:hypothetical protein